VPSGAAATVRPVVASVNRLVFALLAVVTVAVAVGLVVFWPGDGRANVSPVTPGLVQGAEVLSVSAEGCEQFAGPDCRLVRVVLTDGRDEGARSYFAMPSESFAPVLSPGDRIRVQRNGPLSEDTLDDPAVQPLAFVDFQRGRALFALVCVFAILVVALARWQGLRSLIGLAVSLVLVIGWIVPAILSGQPPLATALVGGVAVMLATTALTHGLGLKSAAAILGATVTLVLIVAMSVVAVEVAHITGLSSEESTLLDARARGGISIQGLVIAGFVIGALGVLDDVTVSQSSTVLALRRADPRMPARRLFREAMTVGRDHLGATVNTLVLAYTGASLPILLVFAGQGTPFFEAVGYEAVAEEIVATLVGSIGLVAAVPLTTALATLLATRAPAAQLRPEPHSHSH
jgi:uncharacterized membrane protein